MAKPSRPGTVWGDTMSPDGENRRLYIGGLPKNITLQDLREKFEKHGTIEGISIKQGYAFLQYRRPCEVLGALLEDKTNFLGLTIQVRQYRSDSKPNMGEKAKSKRDRSRSPPASRNSTRYEDWPTSKSTTEVTLTSHHIQPSTFNAGETVIGNEVEVIVYESKPDTAQKQYAEYIEGRVKHETNISTVDIIYRRETDELTALLNDLYRKKTLYAILISPLDPTNQTATLYLIRDTTAPRYTNLNDLINFMRDDYQDTYSGKPPSFRYEQFTRTDVGFFPPSQAGSASSQYYTRHPATNMQARLGGYKVDESNRSFSDRPSDSSLSRNDISVESSFSDIAKSATPQQPKPEAKPNVVITRAPNYLAQHQQEEQVKMKDEKMPRDVELSLRLILEQGNCRSMSVLQLESIVDYMVSQKNANRTREAARVKMDQEAKPDIKDNVTRANMAPVANAFNVLQKSGIGTGVASFDSGLSHAARASFVEGVRQESAITIKEEPSDEPMIIREKIANKNSNQNSSANQGLSSSNISSVLDSAFDVLQKSGICARNANTRQANNTMNQNNGTQNAGLFNNNIDQNNGHQNPNVLFGNLNQSNGNQTASGLYNSANSFQSNVSRRHPLNGTQIYPDQQRGSTFNRF